jgi:D-alanyl-D-alanine carboxypeptidase/D-alanyl-D-alanine-endopeptidase (penicillin-binding protein 4)
MHYKHYFYFLGIVLFLSSCAVKKKQLSQFGFENQKHFTGLLVYDPATRKTLIDTNSELYFTPASTLKLFTLYTSLNYLPDSIATFSYFNSADTLYIKPLADPSFLHDSLPNTSFSFIKNQTNPIALVADSFEDFLYGDGWQWDDYQFYYMPEKSMFPIYGNVALIKNDTIIPKYFKPNLQYTNETDFHREFFDNQFYYNGDKRYKVPFRTSLSNSLSLLNDTLNKTVSISNFKTGEFKPYISTPTLPLYHRLMNESENFMAEQLFLLISKAKTGKYQVKNTIQIATDSLLKYLPNQQRWVDASGLSRYNITTPRNMVFLLDKMLTQFGQEKIFDLMPKNGENESLQKWYPFEKTYLYAKTGSVSNNHSLCGYLITKKGTLLIFSYMNNNFIEKSSDIRVKMNEVLQQIYINY